MTSVIPAPGEFLVGVVLFLIVVWDAFEAIILPRRVTRKFRLTRAFYQSTWRTWKLFVNLLPARKTREALFGFYGPMSLILLIGFWVSGLLLGFCLRHHATRPPLISRGPHLRSRTTSYLI